jgi:hypothetical protein
MTRLEYQSGARMMRNYIFYMPKLNLSIQYNGLTYYRISSVDDVILHITILCPYFQALHKTFHSRSASTDSVYIVLAYEPPADGVHLKIIAIFWASEDLPSFRVLHYKLSSSL